MENENIKISTYTPAMKMAIKKYKLNNRDKINEIARIYYNSFKDNEEVKLKRKEHQKIRYQNQKAKKIALMSIETI